jgi:hypothetical protein
MRMAPEVNVQLPHRCAISAKAMDVHLSRAPKCLSFNTRARPASRSSLGLDRSAFRCMRLLMTSAHL